MADDPRKPSWMNRLFRRPPEAVPPAVDRPSQSEPEDPPRRRARSRPAVPGRTASRAPGPADEGRRRPRRAPRAEFEHQSQSGRIKREQEFERRFKGEVARAEAQLAMDDHAKIAAELQRQQIDHLRTWQDRLDRLTAGYMPTPGEAGADINRRGRELFERFDRDMAENDAVLRNALDMAAALDLEIDLTRQKRLGYTPNRPRDFSRAATPPEPPAPGDTPQAARPTGPRTVLDHPFNEAATRPAPIRPTAEPAFNDAVTAPDPLAAYFVRFKEAAPPPDPARPPLAPSR